MIFFFNDTATTEIYTLSLHDALPIYPGQRGTHRAGDAVRVHGAGEGRRLDGAAGDPAQRRRGEAQGRADRRHRRHRSEEHTSELQSRQYLVCRLLLEKKKYNDTQSAI